jgi:hypothetical protein
MTTPSGFQRWLRSFFLMRSFASCLSRGIPFQLAFAQPKILSVRHFFELW